MIDGVRLKVCGLQTVVDAEFADRCGVDCLGFNLYPKSPRAIPLAQYAAIAAKLPGRKRVAVMVAPTTEELAAAVAAGFDFFQIHFQPDAHAGAVAGWSRQVGHERLWLAPRLAPDQDVPEEWLALADTFLLDAVAQGLFGGTGQTGDWKKFERHRTAHPDQTWILAGGLKPENIAEALRATGAGFVDVNSGIEAAPGVKDHARLKQFIVRLHDARTGDTARG